MMRDDKRGHREMSRWALPASVVLHLVIAALLIFGLPVPLSEPREEEAIKVDLVPPPKSSDKAKSEPEKPPPAGAPQPEKPREPNVEKPSPASNDAARHGPSPVLRPVFQFGEKDAGPRPSPSGNSAEEGSPSPVAPRDPDKQDLSHPAALATAKASAQGVVPEARETSAAKPTDTANAAASKLQQAKTLFSPIATGNPTATTAMADVPRGVRAGQLCVTELRDQLLHALPPYFPELLPSHQLKQGTVIEFPRTAFRANRQWYNLSYRCEVDADAMKVVSFTYQLGGPIPRSEWKRRGLPSQ
jgi:hypothetical protein